MNHNRTQQYKTINGEKQKQIQITMDSKIKANERKYKDIKF